MSHDSLRNKALVQYPDGNAITRKVEEEYARYSF